jgi:hypothetical protein
VVAELPELLEAAKHPRAKYSPGTIPGWPACTCSRTQLVALSIGRSRNVYHRLAQHTRESSSHVSASFVFNIAKREAVGLGIDIVEFREELIARDDFTSSSSRSAWSRKCRSSLPPRNTRTSAPSSRCTPPTRSGLRSTTASKRPELARVGDNAIARLGASFSPEAGRTARLCRTPAPPTQRARLTAATPAAVTRIRTPSTLILRWKGEAAETLRGDE